MLQSDLGDFSGFLVRRLAQMALLQEASEYPLKEVWDICAVAGCDKLIRASKWSFIM